MQNANAQKQKMESSVLPYTCVYIDAKWKDIGYSIAQCAKVHRHKDRDKTIGQLKTMWLNPSNQNHVLPCLSVRTGLDLYLRVMNYPPGSEIIMSAINIPDMVYIVKHHGLKIVPLDVHIETTSPKTNLFEALISDKTVAILIAHLYGKWSEMDAIINTARRKNIHVIEDCAETFCGFEKIGHPESDIALFSFGVIKYYTAFGGAIAKIKDENLYNKMCDLNSKYPIQSQFVYFKKLFKYCCAYVLLDCPRVIHPMMVLTRKFNIDHKKYVIKMLRGFPDHLIEKIRHQPSTALLKTVFHRLSNFDRNDFRTCSVKGEYVKERLPESVTLVGSQAEINNYWLFPILVDNADTFVNLLHAMGIDAYRGATQVNIIEPEKWNPYLDYFAPLVNYYPHEARYLMDHVVYLPINKSVPFSVLDQICRGVEEAEKLTKKSVNVRIQSKL
ncbi:uncharacterized protein LOC143059274 isoform X2 [Mytilus galloprovincialis]|uniref:uncharacterized protein LOC143059274 isoform X1 n=1 Tax=Mytilus galloprovincialis TaxID=29158 RepID=UPI003F7CCB55